MALPDNTDPNKLGDQILQQQIDKMTQRGELNFTSWAQSSRPASGWNMEAFQGLMQTQTPSTPAFQGASTPMGWLKLAKDDIGGAEGNETYAYHGSLSPERKAGKFRVTDGDNVNGHEVSVGFGFNLTQPGGRQLYEAAVGNDGPAYEDVLNGRKPISQANAVALQEYMILQKNAILDRQLGGTPIRDHQRAALVSMLYQGVNPKAVVEAIKRGEPDAQIADLIRRSGPAGFASRRNHEASRFMGAAAEKYFDNSTNRIPGRTAESVAMAETNPRDRH
ncbi:hypothetical protein [Variovorax paradoxus]|uniref:hypothetical protein n=1 Tax=Variovorax paradoxus TaxID=34073 RepID=UPI0028650263|nr:hypothetical protein [Variovorax paradoxus]MDR6455496.1 hypothetical protein [Variovorax paradoxus]